MFSHNEKVLYKLHGKRIKKKIEDALITIEKFCVVAPHSHVSVSWGKDSIVLLDLCKRVKKDIDIVWIDRGEGGDVPDVYGLIERYKERGYRIRRVPTPKSILNLYEDYSVEEVEQKKLITHMLKETCNKVNAEYDGFFWGIRAKESKGRKMFAKCYKGIFERTTGAKTCSPLLWWTARDIWAYIYINGVDYNTFYDKVSTRDFERENIRYSNYAGLVGIGDGRIVEIKRFYPELYRRMVSVCPHLKAFT